MSCFQLAKIIALASFVGACSAVPRMEDITRKTTYDIVENIRCQAKKAASNYSYYKTASVAYEFSLSIAEENQNSLSSTWTNPFIGGGNFSLGASAGANLSRRTIRNFRLVDTFDQLRAMKCHQTEPETNINFPITGDIGIYEVVGTFIRLQQLDNPAAGEVFTFSDTLNFTTLVSGGISPKITLVPVSGKFGHSEGIANFGASRIDTHQVSLTLAGNKNSTSDNGRRTALGSTLDPTRTGLAPASSLLSTTILQAGADPKDRALIELDRQRILELQARSQNLLVGP